MRGLGEIRKIHTSRHQEPREMKTIVGARRQRKRTHRIAPSQRTVVCKNEARFVLRIERRHLKENIFEQTRRQARKTITGQTATEQIRACSKERINVRSCVTNDTSTARATTGGMQTSITLRQHERNTITSVYITSHTLIIDGAE
jgi:hypothetical protein